MGTYKRIGETVEAMQYTGSNGAAMLSFAPEVLTQDPETRKLYMEYPVGVKWELVATTWVIKQLGYWENVRYQFFEKTYEEVLP